MSIVLQKLVESPEYKALLEMNREKAKELEESILSGIYQGREITFEEYKKLVYERKVLLTDQASEYLKNTPITRENPY